MWNDSKHSHWRKEFTIENSHKLLPSIINRIPSAFLSATEISSSSSCFSLSTLLPPPPLLGVSSDIEMTNPSQGQHVWVTNWPSSNVLELL